MSVATSPGRPESVSPGATWAKDSVRSPDEQMVVRPAGGLSARQLEVLRWLAEGFTNDQIGERLVIDRATVASHVTQIIKRLGAKNTKNAIALAFRLRLIE